MRIVIPIRSIKTEIITIKSPTFSKIYQDQNKELEEKFPSRCLFHSKEETTKISHTPPIIPLENQKKTFTLKEYDHPTYLKTLDEMFMKLFSQPYLKLEPLNEEMMNLKNELVDLEKNYFIQFILETRENDSLEFLNKHIYPHKSPYDIKRTKDCIKSFLYFVEDFISAMEKKEFVIKNLHDYEFKNPETKKQLQSLLYEILSHLIQKIIDNNLLKFEELIDKEYRLNIHPNKTREILVSYAFYTPSLRKKIGLFENQTIKLSCKTET